MSVADRTRYQLACEVRGRVVQRMDRWARWVTRREDYALGFPRAVNFVRLVPRSSSDGPLLPADIDSEAMQTEESVHRLTEVIRVAVTIEHLCVGTPDGKARECARQLGQASLHARTFETRVGMGYRELAMVWGWLGRYG